MTVKRLRPLPSPEELAAMYPTPHDHRIYGRGHGERVEATIELALKIPEEHRRSIGDLSCGNGVIARQIAAPDARLHLGDFATLALTAPNEIGYLGTIEETLHLMPAVHTFVCSETLEHLDHPDQVLRLIATKAAWLVLSTPLDCWEDTNAEHLWAWDRDGVEELLVDNGWCLEYFASVDSRAWGEPYLYGIWVCS